jgi:hypothetical protein
MVVKVRFGRGPVVTRRKGKNSRIASLASSLLTMTAISCAALGLWRLGTDLDWAGAFVFSDGLFSHWQIWIGAAILVQYASWRLTRYARHARRREVEIAREEERSSQPRPSVRAKTSAV